MTQAHTAGIAARPLVVRCGALGDMVLLTVVIRRLSARLGSPVDVLGTGSWTAPLLRGQPGVGEVHVLPSRRRPYVLSPGKWHIVRELRRRGAGPTWQCDATDIGLPLLRRAGIPPDYVIDTRHQPTIGGEHFVERWIRFADASPPAFAGRLRASGNDTPTPRGAALEVPSSAGEEVTHWLASRGLAERPLIAVQAGNKRTMRRGLRKRASNTKYWPEEHWAAVLRAIHDQRPDAALLLLGVAQEHALNEEIRRLTGAQAVHNLAGDLPVRRLMALLARVESMVSVDSGPAHVAAAVDCPLVVLFGKADPKLYRPRGEHVTATALTGERHGQRDILGIEPDSVIAAWQALPARPRR